jgi:hypothetical protein
MQNNLLQRSTGVQHFTCDVAEVVTLLRPSVAGAYLYGTGSVRGGVLNERKINFRQR